MLYSSQHKAIIYPTSDPARVLQVLPEARPLNGHHIIVPHTLHAMQVMRFMGYPAYAPILTGYDWPRNPHKVPEPFPWQKQMAAFMTLNPRCFNLSEMRTGKTLATLWAADYLMLQGVLDWAIILSPLSTIYRVWDNELANHFLSRRTRAILYGTRQQRLAAASEDKDFYIINHDGLGVGSRKGPKGIAIGDLAGFIRDKKGRGALIVDEGSVYKDSATTRYKVLRQVSAAFEYVFWLTGTPTPVEPPNAWSQARLVRKDYAESYRGFQERTMLRISQFKWVPKREGAALAAQILQPSIRFSRAEVFGASTTVTDLWDVELSPAQKKAYDELKGTLRTQIGAGQINAINEVTLRTKLIQIACGAVYGPEHEVHRVDCAPRLQMLEDAIQEATAKILIFAPLTSVINMLYSELRKHYTVEKVTGETSAKRRNGIFTDYQESENPRIIVADPGCMSHGLDLSAADTIIWFGPTDKSEHWQQANCRPEGPKQKNQLFIIKLAATQTEREIYRRLESNEKMQGAVLEMVKEGM